MINIWPFSKIKDLEDDAKFWENECRLTQKQLISNINSNNFREVSTKIPMPELRKACVREVERNMAPVIKEEFAKAIFRNDWPEGRESYTNMAVGSMDLNGSFTEYEIEIVIPEFRKRFRVML